ncbi:uncharacterized protein [Bos taurus]|uniref:uncharacterized protein isoform X1 n=1 Tax=Bos taurus TaxID=9913 RepID=UPI000D534B93|nr:uncharacterized protein LOC519202 isoform X1 [Bos taurus]
MAFNDILLQLGGVGRFQKIQVILLTLPLLLTFLHNTLQNFTAAIPTHHCRPPADTNLSEDGDLEAWLPRDGQGRPESCLLFTSPQRGPPFPNGTETNGTGATEPCPHGWIYDNSTFPSTIVTEWDLVCTRKTLLQLSQSIFMAGILVGSLMSGIMADRLGRLKVLTWSYLLLVVSGTCTAFALNFSAYCICQFLSGMAVSGASSSSMILSEREPRSGVVAHPCPSKSGPPIRICSQPRPTLPGWHGLHSAPLAPPAAVGVSAPLHYLRLLQVLRRVCPLALLLGEPGPHPEGPAESGPDQWEAKRGRQAECGAAPDESAEGPSPAIDAADAALPCSPSALLLYRPTVVHTPFQPLWHGHESAEFRDQHLPGPGVLHDCGPTILFPGLFGHQITWPQTYPNSLLAVVWGLHCDLCNDTSGSHIPPHHDGRDRKRLFDWLHKLPLYVCGGAVPHSNAAERCECDKLLGEHRQHSEPAGGHDLRPLPFPASFHLWRGPRGCLPHHCPPARDAGAAAAQHTARPGEKVEREIGAEAAGAADGPAPAS